MSHPSTDGMQDKLLSSLSEESWSSLYSIGISLLAAGTLCWVSANEAVEELET